MVRHIAAAFLIALHPRKCFKEHGKVSMHTEERKPVRFLIDSLLRPISMFRADNFLYSEAFCGCGRPSLRRIDL